MPNAGASMTRPGNKIASAVFGLTFLAFIVASGLPVIAQAAIDSRGNLAEKIQTEMRESPLPTAPVTTTTAPGESSELTVAMQAAADADSAYNTVNQKVLAPVQETAQYRPAVA